MKGILQSDPRSCTHGLKTSGFTPQELKGFQEKSQILNEHSEGDHAAFFLKSKSKC
jgi:hypothetical protein